MSVVVTPAIPASTIVAITPSVASAGGAALDLNGVILTNGTRVPIGTLQSFSTLTDATNYFGPTAPETALATIYFNGFNNSEAKPGQLFFWQYAWQQPVSAYLRGGSVAGLTLAQLQALSGTLSVTIDGVTQTASALNLSAATSFSNGAGIIGAGLGIHGQNQGAYTGSIAGTTLTVSAVTNGPPAATLTGSITGTTLTVSALGSGTLAIGQLVTGTGVSANTTITALGTGTGGVGTYTVNNAQTSLVEPMTAYAPAGVLAIGDVVTGTGVTANTYITGLGTGTGGVGTYTVTPSQTAASETINGWLPGVTYDAVASAFVINSGTTGVASTLAFATGTLAATLMLTQATGALLSQGAAQSTPAGAMAAIVAITQNWAQFMTAFEPVSTDKTAFAAWASGTGNRYAYAMWTTDVTNTQAGGPSPAVAAILAAGYSGTSMIYENPAVDATGQIAAFILGYGASIDFYVPQGRANAAFRAQAGLAPHVFSATVATFLKGYGLNFYGDYTTANQAFTFYYPGSITGSFAWLDDYLDQIWLNNQFQLQLMELFVNTLSIPYNQAGNGLIAAACSDVIAAGIFNGIIQPGVTLSAAQAAEVNAASGGNDIAPILSTRGWYLQVLPASAAVRAARGSPPINFWWTSGQSVNQISLNSILVQ
jgi:hypothetical protein